MKKIAVIVPFYNEEKRIQLNSINELMSISDVHVFLANDGSTDNTIDILKKINNQYPENSTLFDYLKNQGKANTIYKSILKVSELNSYDYIGYLDADFSTPVKEYVKIIEEIKLNKKQLIFASRIKLLNSSIIRKWYRHYIGRIIITLINSKFHLGIYDTQCGAKIFSKTIIEVAFQKPFLTAWLFDIEMFIRLKEQNLLVKAQEYPIENWKDVDGSKLGFTSVIKIFKEIYILFKNY